MVSSKSKAKVIKSAIGVALALIVKEVEVMKKILAIMTGTVTDIRVKIGDSISEGDEVIVLESMKMEIPIAAEASGVVKKIYPSVGDFVNEEDVLLELE